MLRELTREEWELVSGGDITVTGGRGGGNDFDWASYHWYYFSSSYDEGYGDGSIDWSVNTDPPPPAPDTDGDGVLDDADADPNNPNIQRDIIVNGLRVDNSNSAERMQERLYYALNGSFINAELMPNGEYQYIPTEAPTADQLKFKHNLDQAKSALWFLDVDNKPHTSSTRIAQILTDAGIDVVTQNLNLLNLYREFTDLMSNGQVQNNANSFTDWIWSTQLGGRPPEVMPLSIDTSPIFDSQSSVIIASGGTGGSRNGGYSSLR